MTKKLLIDYSGRGSANEDVLALRLLNLNQWIAVATTHEGATQEDVERCRAFPQKKYSEREACWFVQLTEPNVEHLLASWTEGEYELTPVAQMALDVFFGALKLRGKALDERMAYLAEGVAPQLDDYLYAEPPPLPHQVVAFSSARRAEVFAFIMEMGTGKTRVSVDLICDRARRARATDPAAQFRAVVVAPKSICHNWLLEVARWTTLDANVVRLDPHYDEERRKRVYSKLDRAGELLSLLRDKTSPLLLAVINYEGLEIVEDYLRRADGVPQWDLAVFDESIWIKNPEAKRSRAAYRLAEAARSRFLLTGLPITKNVLDLYGQFHALKPGLLGFTTYYAFQQHYGEKNWFGSHSTYKKDKLPELMSRLARVSFSIKRAQCLDLPPKSYQIVEPQMGKDQAAAYDQMSDQLVLDLDRVAAGEKLGSEEALAHELARISGDVDDSRTSLASIVLVKLLRLSQITSGFVTMNDGSLHRFETQPKIDALLEFMGGLPDDAKVLVWSRFTPEIQLAAQKLNEKNYPAVTFYGENSDRENEDAIARFKKDPKVRAFVSNPSKGGFGLNLQEAQYAVYLSNSFKFGDRGQSEDRCHRMGQKNAVLYLDVMVPNTVDQLIWERLKAKRELSDLLTDRAEVLRVVREQQEARRAA